MSGLQLPRRVCKRPGCNQPTTEGEYCPACRTALRKRQDQERGSASKRGYDRTWRKKRYAFMHGLGAADTQPRELCELCLAQGIYREAEEVHHVIRIVDRPDLRLDDANLQPLCKPCHSAITRAQQRR